MLRAVNEYTDALILLDQYDHQALTLVAITLMIAESKPEEKDVMVKLIMNLLKL